MLFPFLFGKHALPEVKDETQCCFQKIQLFLSVCPNRRSNYHVSFLDFTVLNSKTIYCKGQIVCSGVHVVSTSVMIEIIKLCYVYWLVFLFRVAWNSRDAVKVL
jgi:hypothetical protein